MSTIIKERSKLWWLRDRRLGPDALTNSGLGDPRPCTRYIHRGQAISPSVDRSGVGLERKVRGQLGEKQGEVKWVEEKRVRLSRVEREGWKQP